MTATYSTPSQVADFLNINEKIPAFVSGTAPTLEEVKEQGSASNSGDILYLAQNKLISGTLTLTHGTSATATQTALTETTHYTINIDRSKITLTSAGATAIGTDGVYAEYEYNTLFNNSKIQSILDRSQSMIDELTNNHWADGTDATPDYEQVTEEKHKGKGDYDREYYTNKYPIPDVTTTLNGAVTADDTTITVVSTNGFPSSGSISIGTDRIDYTGKTSTTFTGCTSVSAHATGLTVNSWVVEVSNTTEGSEPVFEVIEKDVDYDLDLSTGRITILRDLTFTNTTDAFSEAPNYLVPNRLRFTGQVGYDEIPDTITHLCILITAQELINLGITKALINGIDGFVPQSAEKLQPEIDRLIKLNTHIHSDNI